MFLQYNISPKGDKLSNISIPTPISVLKNCSLFTNHTAGILRSYWLSLGPPSVLGFLLRLRPFFASPSPRLAAAAEDPVVGGALRFFFRQLRGLGLLRFLLRLRPRPSSAPRPIPRCSFRLLMLCCWVGVTRWPACTAATRSSDAADGRSSTMVLSTM